jgi:hypothetical protein
MTELNLNRRALLAALLAASPFAAVSGPKTPVEVWKDPSCGCCGDWVKYLERNGFAVTVVDRGNNAVRAQLGIDPKYGSCHTAIVGGYAIEGHVPVTEIRRLLAEKPSARGLAVPGMKIGSPGMDGPAYKGRRDEYDVLLLAKDGSASVYRHYDGNKS